MTIEGNVTYGQQGQLKLICLSEGGPDLEYSWSRMLNDFDNETTIGTNNNTLTIENVTTDDGGNYACAVTNDAGTSNATVTVYSEWRFFKALILLLL